MKCVILAGGKGSRIRKENDITPKPLTLLDEDPIILHIMRIYYHYGIKEFIICLGYMQEEFKKYFINLMNQKKDIKLDFKNQKISTINNNSEDWNVTLVDTGLNTLTGARLKKIENYLDDDDDCFFLTYADAVSDININELYKFHKEINNPVTITVVPQKERFGIVELENNNVKSFREKNQEQNKWINAGFMVINKTILKELHNDSGTLEQEILYKLAKGNQLSAYKYLGFWQCMDFQVEREYLSGLLKENKAPWKKINK